MSKRIKNLFTIFGGKPIWSVRNENPYYLPAIKYEPQRPPIFELADDTSPIIVPKEESQKKLKLAVFEEIIRFNELFDEFDPEDQQTLIRIRIKKARQILDEIEGQYVS